MSIRINVRFPGPEGEALQLRAALDALARATIDDEEAGQRDARLTPLLVMVARAWQNDPQGTTALLRRVKQLATGQG